MKKYPIILLTSRGGGHCLHIAEEIECGNISSARLVSIVTDYPQAAIVSRAKERALPIAILDWGGGDRPSSFEAALLDFVNQVKPILIVLAGYRRLLRGQILSDYERRIINIHPSLLPSFPGMNAIARAYAAGEKQIGATVHFVDQGMDTGEVLFQDSYQVTRFDTLETVTQAVHAIEAQLLTLAINTLLSESTSYDGINA